MLAVSHLATDRRVLQRGAHAHHCKLLWVAGGKLHLPTENGGIHGACGYRPARQRVPHGEAGIGCTRTDRQKRARSAVPCPCSCQALADGTAMHGCSD